MILQKLKAVLHRLRLYLRIFFFGDRKFNVGSANVNPDKSWIPTDLNTLDITKASDWRKMLLWFKADNIMAEHVWEHLSKADTELANANCHKFLKNGGVLRIAVPDGYHPDMGYIEHVRPGGTGPGADDHKILYTYKTLSASLKAVGFKVHLLEYWDEHGQFHFVDWTNDSGFVRRSSRYDQRNKNGGLVYTSLIVDAVK